MERRRGIVYGVAVILILGIIVITGTSFVHAQDFPKAQDDYVNDFSGIFDAGQIAHLRGVLRGVREVTTAEVVVVTLETINGEDIGDYTVKLGQEWGVGKSDKDNGFVVLYVSETNKIYAASGYGLEGILPDSKIGRLLDENYVPLRDSGNVSGGILRFVDSVSNVLYENKDEILSGESGNNFGEVIGEFFPIIIWIVILFFVSYFNYKNKKKDKRYSRFPWWVLFFLPSRGSGGGFSSGGFSGGFGGGGFGGGGAGR